MKRLLLSLLFAVFAFSTSSQTKVLFDATKHEMAGNADWVIDADAWNNNMPAYPCTGSTNESNPQRYPTPDQSGITQATPETYWTGGISAWAVDIVKTWGWTVESLPPGASITYGDGGNAQDLSNYDVFIICEPQNQFTTAEKNAIIAFVQNGGGLFMVADHETSDRDCDGWDSPWVYNDLTGATSASSTGLFGIWFRVDGLEVKGEDWFDDGTDNNVNTDTSDPIIFGPGERHGRPRPLRLDLDGHQPRRQPDGGRARLADRAGSQQPEGNFRDGLLRPRKGCRDRRQLSRGRRYGRLGRLSLSRMGQSLRRRQQQGDPPQRDLLASQPRTRPDCSHHNGRTFGRREGLLRGDLVDDR